jgi:hypothetical protein
MASAGSRTYTGGQFPVREFFSEFGQVFDDGTPLSGIKPDQYGRGGLSGSIDRGAIHRYTA